mmetsp:Transcript_18402/g.41419  ORF Transcript_18402/g.41419 Transcript_18402/m.41419 type:complete len:219 (-) Transcript_18402:609-1265(-)
MAEDCTLRYPLARLHRRVSEARGRRDLDDPEFEAEDRRVDRLRRREVGVGEGGELADVVGEHGGQGSGLRPRRDSHRPAPQHTLRHLAHQRGVRGPRRLLAAARLQPRAHRRLRGSERASENGHESVPARRGVAVTRLLVRPVRLHIHKVHRAAPRREQRETPHGVRIVLVRTLLPRAGVVNGGPAYRRPRHADRISGTPLVHEHPEHSTERLDTDRV